MPFRSTIAFVVMISGPAALAAPAPEGFLADGVAKGGTLDSVIGDYGFINRSAMGTKIFAVCKMDDMCEAKITADADEFITRVDRVRKVGPFATPRDLSTLSTRITWDGPRGASPPQGRWSASCILRASQPSCPPPTPRRTNCRRKALPRVHGCTRKSGSSWAARSRSPTVGRGRHGPVRVPVAAHRLGGDLALGPETCTPPNGRRHPDAEALRHLAAGRALLNGGDHSLAQVQRQGSGMSLLRDPAATESQRRPLRYLGRVNLNGSSSSARA